MKTLTRFLAVVAVALALPVFAGSASAADIKLGAERMMPVTGGIARSHDGMLAKSFEPAPIQVAGRRGRWIGPAIVGGIVAGALIAGSRRAHSREYRHYDHRPVRRSSRCDRLYWRCQDGVRRACYKYNNRCY